MVMFLTLIQQHVSKILTLTFGHTQGTICNDYIYHYGIVNRTSIRFLIIIATALAVIIIIIAISLSLLILISLYILSPVVPLEAFLS